MATFHQFPRLPAELRAQIWQMTVEPRIVEVDLKTKRELGQHLSSVLVSSTSVPAPLQTCQEARNARLYRRCFSGLTFIYSARADCERRYVWLNLDIDIVSIGESGCDILGPVAHLIKRLRLTRDPTEEWWGRSGGHYELDQFENVSEIQVVLCEDGDMEDWHGASEHYRWHCGAENVLLIDEKEGLEMKLMDLEYKYDRIWEAKHREVGDDSFLYRNGQIINWFEAIEKRGANS
ncbi:hypothetical protein AG0111_0g2486 [Alternaria gaisen]|uniref:Uncharacterized protein n=1 Tax=Alternaria gaisen TaxID=167740 RepID=A0ACB6FWN2_9PLEO|nr:hypothetical protein AG0111_0g2486 [Alternaria gaisen]